MMSRQRKSSPTSTSAEKASGGGGSSAFRSDGVLKRSRTGLGELGCYEQEFKLLVRLAQQPSSLREVKTDREKGST